MSAPYLNRGESIVLTTHRVSVDAVLFDLMLTSNRVILIDSRYTRFEPRTILFSSIISVKGGMAPTREPAIILTLEETGELSASHAVNLIFAQEPGEERAYEREQWVRKLIELVIQAREQAAKEDTLPEDRMTGVQPSIRRFVAPDTLRPHSSADEPAPAPLPVIAVEPDEPDSLEFFLEGLRSKKPDQPAEELPPIEPLAFIEPEMPIVRRKPPVAVPARTHEKRAAGPSPAAGHETPPVTEPVPPVSLPAEEPVPARELPVVWPVIPQNSTPPASPPAARNATPPVPEPAADSRPSASFASTVLAATSALKAPTAAEHPVLNIPSLPDTPKPVQVKVTESPARDTPSPTGNEVSEDRGGAEIPPVPEPGPRGEKPAPRTPLPGQLRELPGTYSPALPATGIATGPEDTRPSARPPDTQKSVNTPPAGRTALITGTLVIVVLLVVAGSILFLSHSLPGMTGNDQPGTTTPEITAVQTPAPAPTTALPTGVRVNILYPGMFAGTVGDREYPRQVSGTGNQSYTVIINGGIVQASVQKQDNSGNPLTVEIYNNSTLLSKKTVTAPMGEIHLLIDIATASPPGITPGTTQGAGRTGTGNSTLIYY
jgi:hypothetical protein